MHGKGFAGPAAGVRLLVLDVDGTVTNSRHEITDATCRAVERLRAAGIRVVLATGRRYRDVLPAAARLGVDTPLVTTSGALVKRPSDHVTLSAARFEAGVLAGVLGTIVAGGNEPLVFTDSFAEGFDFLCRRLDDGIPPDLDTDAEGGGERVYLHHNRAGARVVPLLDRAPPADAFAVFALGDHRRMLDLEEALRAAWPDRLALHTIKSPRYRDWMCEIAPAGVTKWSGVLRVAGDWGIGPGEICAVGDDVNDLPMIRGAALGIAMGNAQPPVLEAADRVVATHDDGGIEEVADLLLGGLSQPAPLGKSPGPGR
jgi:hydroxymethylpyrimidine pyrophosphatase-like HAD family hydrolase